MAVVPITVTAAATTRAYNGTTTSSATPAITGGSLSPGDTAAFTESFDNKNIGSGKTVTPAGSVIDGGSGDTYTITFNTFFGRITTKAITATAATSTKTYDGTTTSSGTPSVTGGIAGGDTAAFTETYDTKLVGTGKTLTPAGTVNDGNSGSNYSVTFATNTTGEIDAANLDIGGTTVTNGTGTYLLYVDATGHLAQSSKLTFDGTTFTIGCPLSLSVLSTLGFFGATPVSSFLVGGTLSAGLSYTVNEQRMLQDAWTICKTLGLLK